MNLRDTLREAESQLVGKHGLERTCPVDAAHQARKDAGTTWPLAVFIEWVERCPEIKTILAEAGIPWDTESVPENDDEAFFMKSVLEQQKSVMRRIQGINVRDKPSEEDNGVVVREGTFDPLAGGPPGLPPTM